VPESGARELQSSLGTVPESCCFIDRKKKHGMYWWKDCEIGPEDAIDVLIKRCMIKVVDDRFWMHDQFRDLGRVIAKQEHTRLLSSLLDEEKIICELKSIEVKYDQI